MLVTILIILLTVAILGLVACGFIIRGFLIQVKSFNSSYKRRKLTGVQIEEIRRKLSVAGLAGIELREVLDLIYIIRAIQIGDYSDNDPFVPHDPYEGIEEEHEDVTIIPTVRR